MTARSCLALLGLLAAPAGAVAQHGTAGATPPSHIAPREAAQYDFLIGQWELVVKVPPASLAARIHGVPKLTGSWKAWRALDNWGVEDELRITDQAGNPVALTHAVRIYDRATGRWTVSALDVYRARFQPVTAEWRNGEMHLGSSGTDQDGKGYQTRTRIYDITPASFKFQQDRSTDGGRTWTEKVLTFDAKRVAAAAPR